MRFTPTDLPGAVVIDLDRLEDDRGFFARTWCADEMAEHGLSTRIAQANTAFNRVRGTLRGMHWQDPPHAEVKIVRCTRGAVWDVIVDLRPDSPTRLRWIGVELSERNGRALYVPEGFAHGYVTLEDESETAYLMSEFHAPGAARGARFDDPAFGIQWPDVGPLVVSEKDRAWPDYAD